MKLKPFKLKIMFYLILSFVLYAMLPFAVITAETQQNKARRVLWWVLSVLIAAAALLGFYAFTDDFLKDF